MSETVSNVTYNAYNDESMSRMTTGASLTNNWMGDIVYDQPLKISHYSYVCEPADGVSTIRYKGDFEGHFEGTYTGVLTGSFYGDVWLNKESHISEPLYNDTFVQALIKDYFYNHFIEWINL